MLAIDPITAIIENAAAAGFVVVRGSDIKPEATAGGNSGKR